MAAIGGQVLCLGACVTPVDPVSGQGATALSAAAGQADVLLLGEVHDNPTQHRLRADWLRTLARERRFALVLEQFDLDRQADLDQPATPAQAREWAARAGFRFEGWTWTSYAPYVELALEQKLPVFAGNLPASTLMAQARAGEAPAAKDVRPPWTAADTAAMSQEIEAGHCGLLPARAVAPMVGAQRLRDLGMARAVAEAHRRTGLPVVLLAGNGHVRRDLGVPRLLDAVWPGVRIWSVGLLEARSGADLGSGVQAQGAEARGPEARGSEARGSEARGSEARGSEARGPDARGSESGGPEARASESRTPEDVAGSRAGVYDQVVITPAQDRPDACEALRKQWRKPASAGALNG